MLIITALERHSGRHATREELTPAFHPIFDAIFYRKGAGRGFTAMHNRFTANSQARRGRDRMSLLRRSARR